MRSGFCYVPPRKIAIAIERLPYSIKRLLAGIAFFALIEKSPGSKVHPVVFSVVPDSGSRCYRLVDVD